VGGHAPHRSPKGTGLESHIRSFLFLMRDERRPHAESLTLNGALQLLMNRYGHIQFSHAHERVSTKSFVVLIIGVESLRHTGHL